MKKIRWNIKDIKVKTTDGGKVYPSLSSWAVRREMEVLFPGFKEEYRVEGGKLTICRITTKDRVVEGCAEAHKGHHGESYAFKRAAAKLGVGREFMEIDPVHPPVVEGEGAEGNLLLLKALVPLEALDEASVKDLKARIDKEKVDRARARALFRRWRDGEIATNDLLDEAKEIGEEVRDVLLRSVLEEVSAGSSTQVENENLPRSNPRTRRRRRLT